MVFLFTVLHNTVCNYQIFILEPLAKVGIPFFAQGGF